MKPARSLIPVVRAADLSSEMECWPPAEGGEWPLFDYLLCVHLPRCAVPSHSYHIPSR